MNSALTQLIQTGTPIGILLVEDNELDVDLTRAAFEAACISNQMHVAQDGVEALEFLRAPAASGAFRPDVILLDINMPRMNGLEVLDEIKRDPDLMTIPVIMLTTSAAEEDILRSYQAHAASYVVKPVEFDRFFQAIQALGQFMLTIVRVPSPHA